MTSSDAVSYAGLILKLEEAIKKVYPALEDDKDVNLALIALCEADRISAHLKAFLVNHGRK